MTEAPGRLARTSPALTLVALQQLTRNAVLHRTYENTITRCG